MSIPYTVPKGTAFATVMPAGTAKVYDAGNWALYFCAPLSASFIVADVGDSWRIQHFSGILTIDYSLTFMKARMYQMANSGCCGR